MISAAVIITGSLDVVEEEDVSAAELVVGVAEASWRGGVIILLNNENGT
jgi:hypothetical protein